MRKHLGAVVGAVVALTILIGSIVLPIIPPPVAAQAGEYARFTREEVLSEFRSYTGWAASDGSDEWYVIEEEFSSALVFRGRRCYRFDILSQGVDIDRGNVGRQMSPFVGNICGSTFRLKRPPVQVAPPPPPPAATATPVPTSPPPPANGEPTATPTRAAVPTTPPASPPGSRTPPFDHQDMVECTRRWGCPTAPATVAHAGADEFGVLFEHPVDADPVASQVGVKFNGNRGCRYFYILPEAEVSVEGVDEKGQAVAINMDPSKPWKLIARTLCAASFRFAKAPPHFDAVAPTVTPTVIPTVTPTTTTITAIVVVVTVTPTPGGCGSMSCNIGGD